MPHEYDGKPIKIVSKIENVEGFKNFDAILKESDGIVVTHGDLGMPIEDEANEDHIRRGKLVFRAQKIMLQKTKAANKMAICATKQRNWSSLTLAKLF